MPAIAMNAAVFSAGERIYLDTSAFFPLVLAWARSAKGRSIPPIERTRAAALTPFLEAAIRGSAKPLVSILVFEEVGAIARNKAFSLELSAAGFGKRAEARAADPAKLDAIDARVASATLEVLGWAAETLTQHSVALERPAVLPLETAKQAKALRKVHRAVLRNNPSLDSMDALHIAVGAELGVSGFVSFDRAWATLANIRVFSL